MTRKIPFILTLIVLTSGAISFCLLTRGHSWLDDFAAYLMQAKSILNGTMAAFVLRNAFTVNASSYPPGPVAYPWGFPLLLAPLYAAFGLKALTFKLLNTFFYALFLIVVFAFARTRLKDGEALMVTAALGFNPALLQAHDQIISDIPFLFFCTLSIWLADKKQASLWHGLATGAAIFAASFIRTNGMLLLIPLALAQFFALWPQRRFAWKQTLMPYLSFGILYTVQALVFPNGQDSYLNHFSMFTAARLWDNFLYYLWLPAALFDGIPGGAWLYPVLLAFVAVSIWQRGKRDLPIHLFSVATVALYIVWPERQGLRFIYPTLPSLLIFAFDGMKLVTARLSAKWEKAPAWIMPGLWLALITVSLGIAGNMAYANLAADRATNGPFDPVSGEMFTFLREKTPSQSIIIFFRPRALRLFTDRDAFMTENCADLPKGDYLALSEKVGDKGQIAPEAISQCKGVKLEQVFNNQRFTIYKIMH